MEYAFVRLPRDRKCCLNFHKCLKHIIFITRLMLNLRTVDPNDIS